MKYIYIPYDKHKTTSSTPFVSTLIQAGDFSITSNLQSAKTTKIPELFSSFVSYTLDDVLSIGTSPVSNIIPKNVTLKVNNRKLNTWIKYSSIEKNILMSLDYLYHNFPASLSCYNNIGGKQGFNILNASYNPITNKTSFVINTNFIENPLDINYLNFDLPNQNKFATHRILKDSFSNYLFELDGQFYSIMNFEGSNRKQNSYISVEVAGKPFENGNHSLNCYITPSNQIKEDFKKNASEFTLNLLRNEKPDGFYLIYEDEKITLDNVNILYDLTIIFPKYDKYNLDFISSKFETFKEILIEYAKKQDEQKTNIVLRKYIEPNLLLSEFESFNSADNEGDRLEVLLSVFSFGFDEHYKFINGLKNLNILTYNKEDNLSDELLDLYLDSFGIKLPHTTSIEKKRQLGLSLTWLIKNKGTRSAIEYIFQFLNIPLDIVNFKEYVKKIESKIDITLLKKYLSIIYDNDELINISIDEEGYPDPRENYIFEDSIYWNQFYTLDENLNGKFKEKISIINKQSLLYENTFDQSGSTMDQSGSTFDYTLFSSSCYTLQSSIVKDVLHEVKYDECGCEIKYDDNAFQLSIDPIPLYTGCTKPILDIWQECLGVDQIKLHIKPYGGIPPYLFSGVTDGQILPDDTDFSVSVTDSVGCESFLTTGTTFCFNTNCIDNPLFVNLGYVCEVDDNGFITGNATVTLLVSGGTAPYIIHGNENGDILPNGEIIATEVIDALGCTSGILTKEIVCENLLECDFIELDSTGECTSNVRISDTKVNITYDLSNVPNNTNVDNVIMTVTLLSGGTLYGGVVTELFNSQSGAKTVSINSSPSLGIVLLNVNLSIRLLNGCIYTDNYNLAVDCRDTNIPTYYTKILT